MTKNVTFLYKSLFLLPASLHSREFSGRKAQSQFEKGTDKPLDPSGETWERKMSRPYMARIFCANCANCKAFTVSENGAIQRRIRCKAGVWKKTHGEEKTYRYDTILKRKRHICEFYDSMGSDRQSFLASLRDSLKNESTGQKPPPADIVPDSTQTARAKGSTHAERRPGYAPTPTVLP